MLSVGKTRKHVQMISLNYILLLYIVNFQLFLQNLNYFFKISINNILRH